jgi:two-component system cell cycle response regulator CpdR
MGLHKRILVVDDEERVLFVLSHALQRAAANYDVITARDGGEALRQINESSFDLLITDLRLPVMDGVALTKAIRGAKPAIPVIWITAYGNSEARAEGEQLSVYRILDKPVEIAEIREVVQQALRSAAN